MPATTESYKGGGGCVKYPAWPSSLVLRAVLPAASPDPRGAEDFRPRPPAGTDKIGAMPAAADRRRSRWPELALVVLTFWVYLNAFGNDFVWDDVVLIVNNPAIKHWGTLPALSSGDILPGPEGVGENNSSGRSRC